MKLIKHLFIIILTIVSFEAKPSEEVSIERQSFLTDGCTMFIDKLDKIDKNWHPCCVEHDFRYWIGGERPLQDHADLKLKECLEVLATPFIAKLMYKSVRLGHYSPIKHHTQWGWGKVANVSSEDKEFILMELIKIQDMLFSKEVLIEEFDLFKKTP